MTVRSKATIKSYFVRGAKPTQANYGDLIDSYQDYSPILDKINILASAGANGFIDVQSDVSADFIQYGAIGLQVLLSESATSAKQVLNIGAAVSAEFATTAQAIAGAVDGISMSPVLTKNAIQAFSFTSANYSTTAQAIAGSNVSTVMNPSLVKSAIVDNTFNSIGVGTSVISSAATSIPNGVATAIAFNSTNYDDFNWHSTSTNNTRITVDYNGKLQINGRVSFTTSQNGVYTSMIYKNGSEITRSSYGLATTSNPTIEISDVIDVSANDYVELYGQHNVGVSLNTNTSYTKFVATRMK